MVTHPFLQNGSGLPLEFTVVLDEACPSCSSKKIGVLSEHDRTETVHCIRCDWMLTRARTPRGTRREATFAVQPGMQDWTGVLVDDARFTAFANGPWPLHLDDSSVLLSAHFDGDTLICRVNQPWSA